jgi:hypothetical protein
VDTGFAIGSMLRRHRQLDGHEREDSPDRVIGKTPSTLECTQQIRSAVRGASMQRLIRVEFQLGRPATRR